LLSEAGADGLSAASAERLSDIASSPVRATAERVASSPDVRRFAGALFEALDAVGEAGTVHVIPADRLTELFSFDGYPGARAYVDAAGKAGDCRHP
jgi:hypothetical protein